LDDDEFNEYFNAKLFHADYSKDVWNGITPEFYTLFNYLDLSNIYLPEDLY